MSDALQAADVTLTRALPGPGGADVELRIPRPEGEVAASFNVKKRSVVKPSDVDRLPAPASGEPSLLVVADRMSDATVERLRRRGYSWLSRSPLASGLRGELHTAHDVHPVHDARVEDDRPVVPGRGRPARATGRVAQALFYLEGATQRDLVEETGLSQARVSQILRDWPQRSGVVRVAGRPARWQVDDPDALMSTWLDHYLPEERVTTYWYGLDGPREQAEAALEAMAGRGRVSGELAADALAPWAVPETALVYSDEGRDLAGAGLVPCPRDAATLELVATRDPAVIPSERAVAFMAAASPSAAMPLADPLVVLSDLARSSGLDADQSTQRLRARLGEMWHQVDRRG